MVEHILDQSITCYTQLPSKTNTIQFNSPAVNPSFMKVGLRYGNQLNN